VGVNVECACVRMRGWVDGKDRVCVSATDRVCVRVCM